MQEPIDARGKRVGQKESPVQRFSVTRRRRNRTFQAEGCSALPVLKTIDSDARIARGCSPLAVHGTSSAILLRLTPDRFASFGRRLTREGPLPENPPRLRVAAPGAAALLTGFRTYACGIRTCAFG